MKIKLSNLVLPQVQEVTSYDRRSLAEHKPPGMAGSIFQNLGRHATYLTVWGVATGSKARQFIEDLDAKFRAAKPVPFSADLIAGAGISQTLIANLQVQDLAGKPDRFDYVLTLREFIKPEKAQGGLDAGIKNDARRRVNQLVSELTQKK